MSTSEQVLAAELSFLYGKLTVVRSFRNASTRHRECECKCQCGQVRTFRLSDLMRGHVVSCGCERARTTHGERGTPTWWSWIAMRRRCNDPSHQDYKHYGGRGIRVCDEWNDAHGGYEAFKRHVGERPPDRTLDRKDVNKGYEPGNVRWATKLEQEFNKRRWTRVNARREVLKQERQSEDAYWEAQEAEYLAAGTSTRGDSECQT